MYLDLFEGKTDSVEASDPRFAVASIMTRRVITLRPDHSFSDSVSLMAKHSFRHFLVVQGYRVVGVVSDRDILRVLARTKDWQNTTVSQFMIRELITVRPDTPISIAVGEMLSNRINCLPVVDDRGDLQGIVTSTDLLNSLRSIQELLEKGQIR
jgi:acetoin utilization protein AcuB